MKSDVQKKLCVVLIFLITTFNNQLEKPMEVLGIIPLVCKKIFRKTNISYPQICARIRV